MTPSTATADRLRVDLGADARARRPDHRPGAVAAPERSGGSSVFQAVPALNQYWHPWLLGGSRARHGRGRRGHLGRSTAAQVYGEKNWGKGGFPDSWWWGQAQGFVGPVGACVAFAGGDVTAGPLRTTVTALVVLLPDGRLVRLGDPVVSPVRAEVTDEQLGAARPQRPVAHRRRGVTAPSATAHVLPVPLPAGASQRRRARSSTSAPDARLGAAPRPAGLGGRVRPGRARARRHRPRPRRGGTPRRPAGRRPGIPDEVTKARGQSWIRRNGRASSQLVGELQQRALVTEVGGEVHADRQPRAGRPERQGDGRTAGGVVHRGEGDVGLQAREELVEVQRRGEVAERRGGVAEHRREQDVALPEGVAVLLGAPAQPVDHAGRLQQLLAAARGETLREVVGQRLVEAPGRRSSSRWP